MWSKSRPAARPNWMAQPAHDDEAVQRFGQPGRGQVGPELARPLAPAEQFGDRRVDLGPALHRLVGVDFLALAVQQRQVRGHPLASGDQAAQRGGGRILVKAGIFERIAHLGDGQLVQRLHQRGLACEVAMQRGAAHPDGGGDLVLRGVGPPAEEVGGRAQQPVSIHRHETTIAHLRQKCLRPSARASPTPGVE